MSAGITLVYVVGAVTTWRVACIICGAIPILVAITMPFLPETPNWLIANNKKEDAYKVKGLCIISIGLKYIVRVDFVNELNIIISGDQMASRQRPRHSRGNECPRQKCLCTRRI